MNTRPLFFAALLLTALGSCDTGSPSSPPPLPLPPQMSGAWSGGTFYLMRVNVVEQNGDIVGTGMFNGTVGGFVRGRSSYPAINFSMSSQGYSPVYFTGTYVHPDTIVGTLDGSGFVNAPLTLGRYE